MVLFFTLSSSFERYLKNNKLNLKENESKEKHK